MLLLEDDRLKIFLDPWMFIFIDNLSPSYFQASFLSMQIFTNTLLGNLIAVE